MTEHTPVLTPDVLMEGESVYLLSEYMEPLLWCYTGTRTPVPGRGTAEPDILIHRNDFDVYLWVCEGVAHRENDLPAEITVRAGRIEKRVWYVNGRKHRENDLPAVESDDIREWHRNGLLHREDDLPAVLYGNDQGTRIWCQEGSFARLTGPAMIKTNGDAFWFWRGNLISPQLNPVFEALQVPDITDDDVYRLLPLVHDDLVARHLFTEIVLCHPSQRLTPRSRGFLALLDGNP